MADGKTLAVFLFWTTFYVIMQVRNGRRLPGYKFPVFTTKICPRNESEFNERSSELNCTEMNGYMCLPNENYTELLEFCYTLPRIATTKGLCLFLDNDSKLNMYDCDRFIDGCPDTWYLSYKFYEYPNCWRINNGCFLAEPSCFVRKTTQRKGISSTGISNGRSQRDLLETNFLIRIVLFFL